MEYKTQNGVAWYPDKDPKSIHVVVSLYDVRAADDLYLTYDFARDGWSARRMRMIDHHGYYEEVGEPIEVAFLPSWQLEEDSSQPSS